jgi:hypothetical protein
MEQIKTILAAINRWQKWQENNVLRLNVTVHKKSSM